MVDHQARVTGWGIVCLIAITCIVMWTSTVRYMDPVGEKYVPVLFPGSVDFFHPYSGARALLWGLNPYTTTDFRSEGGFYGGGGYPPTHLLLYLPLAMIEEDWREAGRIMFTINVAQLFFLAWVTWWILTRIVRLDPCTYRYSILLIPLLFFVFSSNVGTSLALERGQGGDVLTATLCWGSLVLFIKKRIGLAVFLSVGASLIKGYGLVFAGGLFLFALCLRAWKPALWGGLLGAGIFLLPVAQYIPDAIDALKWRLDLYLGSWYNHSFYHAFESIASWSAQPGRFLMIGLAIITAGISWICARKAMRDTDDQQSVMWLSMFALSSLTLTIASARYSVIYNLIVIMPGTLLFFIGGHSLLHQSGLPRWSIETFKAFQLLAAASLFLFKAGSETVPMAGFGMVLLVVLTTITAVTHAIRKPGKYAPTQ